MTLDAAGIASTAFRAIGVDVTVLCTDATELPDAEWLTRTRLAALDMVASRFRPDSELARINALSAESARTDPGRTIEVEVSALLAGCLAAAAHVERLTDGLVSAALGAELAACGYDDDIAVVQARDDALEFESSPPPRRRGSAGFGFDRRRGVLTLCAGAALDLGASSKAWVADSIADDLAGGSGGFLVNLGGDIAVAGEPPMQGWSIGVEDWTGANLHTVVSTGQALATSSTRLRSWVRGGRRRHHIIDPRTGRSARTRWAQVTCAGPNTLQANAAATAAIILDGDAPDWLQQRGLPALLVTGDRQLQTTPGWADA